MDRSEAIEWFPEVDDIDDERLREQTIGAIQQMPEYFFTVPAASSYHPEQHQSRHGLVLHTKRVVTVLERFAPSMVSQGHMSWQDVDYARAACILHDSHKYGKPPTNCNGTRNDHDVIAAEWIRYQTQLPDEVAGAVESHNGPWYRGSPPTSHLEQVVHMSDMVASDPNVDVAIKDPHETLQQRFPTVSTRE